jgi:ribosome maturation factor RimP
MKIDSLIDKLTILIKPIVTSLNYELYYIEFVKENNENYLRVYIDSPEGINLDDCEKVSRSVSDILDEDDPITVSYFLEVSSPGVFRELHTEEHLTRYMGSTVKIKLKSLMLGNKEYIGDLEGLSDEFIMLKVNGESIQISRNNIKSVTLNGEL